MIALHHTGFIVKDIDAYEKNLIYERKINDVIDTIQNARLSLYDNYCNSGVFIELIQPLNNNAFTMNALMKYGDHFNHFCYRVDSMKEMETFVSDFKLVPILGPIPAILFDNKNVCFFYNRNRQVVEFLIDN
jgi:methylmalonyl-CoA/ethylmalonyl-CoA epimerase